MIINKKDGDRVEMKIKSIFAILLILLIGIVSATTLSFSPSPQQINIGQEFEINVSINDVIDLYSFQFDLTYDSAIISYIDVSNNYEGPFLSSDGQNTFALAPTISPGFLNDFAATRYGTLDGINGDGIIAQLRFTGLNAGTSNLVLSGNSLYDSNDVSPQPIVHNIYIGVVNVVDSSCTDFDLDGYNTTASAECGAVADIDCDDGVPSINPGASDSNCNSVDENCIGGADDGYSPSATNCGIGVCASTGLLTCVSGVEQDSCVVGSPSGIPETVCNGVDDDCDSSTDEDYVIDDTCGLGVCFITHIPSNCVSGVETLCQPGFPTGSDDDCNNIDEDCSGTADDNYISISTNCGVGVCASTGLLTCVAGTEQDSCVAGSPTELGIELTCDDNLDNDCDGSIDCPDGDCAPFPICTGCFDNDGDGYDICNPGDAGDDGELADCNDVLGLGENINPGKKELCNTVNDDCDAGTVDGVDEVNYGQATTCGVGVCDASGIWDCVSGTMTDTCSIGTPTGPDDDCDLEDENCDGTINENYVSDASCGEGVCLSGNTPSTCVAGSETLCQPGAPTEIPESTCIDNLDNDCDSFIDCVPGFEDFDCGCCVITEPGIELTCDDGLDNDCDGFTDCDPLETDCAGDPVCISTCSIGDLSWATISADEGDIITITVIGTAGCDGENIDFTVLEYDGFADEIIGGADDAVGTEPLSATFVGGVATTTWITEWQDDGLLGLGGDPEYYFVTDVNGQLNESGKTSEELLVVSLTEQKFEGIDITLQAGKNSFSLPLILEDMSIPNVFNDIAGDVDRIYTYDGGFKIYHFDGKPSNLQVLEPGKGYILFMNNPAVLTINGSKRQADLTRPTINLVQGWNLIGTFSNPYEAATILRDVSYSELYIYNEGSGSYDFVTDTTQLNKEESYWIYVNADSQFIPITGTVIGEEDEE